MTTINHNIGPHALKQGEIKNFKFFMSVSQWQGDMPVWQQSFTDLENEDLVSYIKTFR